MPDKSRFMMPLMIGGTFFGFTLLAFLIHALKEDTPFLTILVPGSPVVYQVIIGALLGLAAAGIACLVMFQCNYFEPLREFSRNLYRMMAPSLLTIVLISLAAGWGEEILFRGVLQPRIGLWFSSLVFAGIHTGFDPRTRVKRQYFATVFLISLGLGVLYKEVGLYAAMTAHAAWDFTVLMVYRHTESKTPVTENIEISEPDFS